MTYISVALPATERHPLFGRKHFSPSDVRVLMRATAKLSAAVLLLTIGSWTLSAASGSDSPATQPDRPFRLFLRSVNGSQPSESVFVIVSPDGYPCVTTFSRLRTMIVHTVAGPATLIWEGSDVSTGPAPLDKAADEESLASFCKEHNIKFVIEPAGHQ